MIPNPPIILNKKEVHPDAFIPRRLDEEPVDHNSILEFLLASTQGQMWRSCCGI